MKELIKFFNDFSNNKGVLVFLSILSSKLVLLINTIFIVKMIDQEEFGRITLIASILVFFTPLNGLGSNQVLIKYGSEEKSFQRRESLSKVMFRKGFVNQIILSFFFVVIASLYSLKFNHLWLIIGFFTLRLIGFYFLIYIQSHYRMHGCNNRYAYLTIATNIAGLLIMFILVYRFNALGYLIALAITPFLGLLYYKKHHFQSCKTPLQNLNWKKMWNFGRYESFAYFASELLFSVDIFMIALFLKEVDIALYKVAILLPMNLLFLPTILFQTDFPKLIRRSQEKAYLRFYITNYYRLFIPICIGILFGSYFLGEWILQLFFGKIYASGDHLFFIASITVVCSMLFRTLYLNLLSVVGLARWNLMISLIGVVILVILGFLLIPLYGMSGAVFAMTISFLLMGLLAMTLFYRHYTSMSYQS